MRLIETNEGEIIRLLYGTRKNSFKMASFLDANERIMQKTIAGFILTKDGIRFNERNGGV